jgi:LuxR family maltose regulon positive regulatory protein
LESLQKAIELAAPEGYFRLFLDEDPCILPLLGKVRSLAPEFVDILAEKYRRENAYRKSVAGEKINNSALSEPLSDRELEVLELVAAGLSNREIADKLFISLGTTKWHITNILSKLGVRNRVQAIKAAESILFS